MKNGVKFINTFLEFIVLYILGEIFKKVKIKGEIMKVSFLSRAAAIVSNVAGKVAKKAELHLVDITAMQIPDAFIKANKNSINQVKANPLNIILNAKLAFWSLVGKASEKLKQVK